MKLAISNIAWEQSEDKEIAEILKSYNVKGIEIAPSKIWSNPLEVSQTEVQSYRKWWKAYGISIVGMQALLYGKPDLTLFDSETSRKKTLSYLLQLIQLAGQLGIKAMVFGSPKNRRIGNLNKAQADEIAQDFFRKIGEASLAQGVQFCIEPNPSHYECNYLTTVKEAISLVRTVDHPGFRLHLDSGGMILNSEDAGIINELSTDEVAHFHISAPFLELPNTHQTEHKSYSNALVSINYKGWLSIEMKAQTERRPQVIEKVLKQAKSWYSI